MAATRLSDAQKQEIVGRYRQGETSAALANAYGCSANTVSRVLKAALDPEDYERLKQQRGRSGRSAAGVSASADGSAGHSASDAAAAVEAEPALASAAEDDIKSDGTASDAGASDTETGNDERSVGNDRQRRRKRSAGPALAAEADPSGDEASVDDATAVDDEADDDDDSPGVLAIDDADDFGDDDEGDDAVDDDGSAEDDAAEAEAAGAAERELVQCQALIEAELPGSAYLLVDKTVELQPTPLRDCADLGPLPEEEADRQALQVYLNPRHAKRHCGRSQRVIKLPDLSVLQRTAPYLLAQGISRVVIEGSLYSLPGS